MLSALVAAGLAWRVTKKRRPPPAAKSVYLPGAAKAPGPAPAARAQGCGVEKKSPRSEAMTTSSGRTFHVWGPDDYDAGHAYPVVLAFHGWSSNGRAFAKWFEMEKHVDGAAFVAYPDSEGDQWDYAGTTDTDFVAAIVDRMAETWCVDRARVLAVGFSYGARFVNHLGCKRPDVVRAIVPGGGAWDKESECVQPMPVLVIHRTNDPTMRIAGGRDAAARWAKIDGCSRETLFVDFDRGCSAFRDCAAGAVTFCEDAFVDPSWPAGWNHTVRAEYRALAWRWFLEVP